MVRTKADSCASGRKVVAAQAPRKNFGGAGSSHSFSDGSSPSGKGKYSGGNPVCPRPTPGWQKGINSFFSKPETSLKKSLSASSSQESIQSDSSSSDS